MQTKHNSRPFVKRDRREALAAIKHLQRTFKPSGLFALNPTRDRIAQICHQYRIEPPATVPKDGWRSVIFAMAPTPAPQRENTQEPPLPPRDEDDPRDYGKTPEGKATLFKPEIRLPGKNWRLSKFGAELGATLALHEFYSKDGVVVIPDAEKPGLKFMDAQTMRTAIEEHVDTVHYYPKGDQYEKCAKTINTEDAGGLLKCPQFIRRLRKVKRINNARFPVRRRNNAIELLPEGYDKESAIITRSACEVEEMTQREGVNFLRDLHSEFSVRPGDKEQEERERERMIAVSLAAALTLFGYDFLPADTVRPGFFYNANAPGAAKTLMAKIAIITKLGYAPTGMPVERKEEMNKTLLAEAIAGATVFFIDNITGHFSSAPLNAVMTAQTIKGRLLGHNRMAEVHNDMTTFATGNGCTYAEDERRRFLIVDLFIRELKAEDRQIKNWLDDRRLIELRPKILGALWALVEDWHYAGEPAGSMAHGSFPQWAAVVGGILEYNGFVNPCTRPPTAATPSGDTHTADMEKLVALIPDNKKMRFGELIEVCWDNDLFARIIGDGTKTRDELELKQHELERDQKARMGALLAKTSGVIFRISGKGHDKRFFAAKT